MADRMVTGALAGIRIVDLSRILGGPYCAQILGDHGADVLKIEPPQGDDTRTWGPPFKDGVASYYLGLNRNKRLMRLDLTTDAGRAVRTRAVGAGRPAAPPHRASRHGRGVRRRQPRHRFAHQAEPHAGHLPDRPADGRRQLPASRTGIRRLK